MRHAGPAGRWPPVACETYHHSTLENRVKGVMLGRARLSALERASVASGWVCLQASRVRHALHLTLEREAAAPSSLKPWEPVAPPLFAATAAVGVATLAASARARRMHSLRGRGPPKLGGPQVAHR
jgi:hypothetical protein